MKLKSYVLTGCIPTKFIFTLISIVRTSISSFARMMVWMRIPTNYYIWIQRHLCMALYL